MNNNFFPLLDLPQDVRTKIWTYLDRVDHKTLRQVSRALLDDIENVVGVYASIDPPDLDPSDLDPPYGMFEHIEPSDAAIVRGKDIEKNISWIRRATVRGLKMRNLSTFLFEPATLLRNPAQLQRLVCVVDWHCFPQINELISLCDGLKVIRLFVEAPVSIEILRQQLPNHYPLCFFQNVLKGLEGSKPDLEELRIELNRRFFEEECFYRLIGMPEKPDFPVINQYPKALKVLKVVLPFCWRGIVEEWVPFLDAQERLVQLHLNFGLVFWAAYAKVLERNAPTLEEVDLMMVNSTQEDDNVIYQRWPEEYPFDAEEDLWFDWAVLSEAEKLNSMKMTMTEAFTHHTSIPYMTKNFGLMHLGKLRKLELMFVSLNSAEFKKIFTNTPSLKRLKLQCWTREIEDDYLKELAKEVCQLLLDVLGAKRLKSITLADACLNIFNCPEDVRHLLPCSTSVYFIDWSPECEYNLGWEFNSVCVEKC